MLNPFASILIFIALISTVPLDAQYAAGFTSGYIRSGFISLKKPDRNYHQKPGLRDGLGASGFFEIVIDSSDNKVKIESGYSWQNAVFDAEGISDGGSGKGPSFTDSFGRKINYNYQLFNVSVLYSQGLIKRRFFSMYASIGLNFWFDKRVKANGFGWDYTKGWSVDSLGNWYQYSKNDNWVVNSSQSGHTSMFSPVLGFELNYHLNKKIDLLFQNRYFILLTSPEPITRENHSVFLGTSASLGVRYHL